MNLTAASPVKIDEQRLGGDEGAIGAPPDMAAVDPAIEPGESDFTKATPSAEDTPCEKEASPVDWRAVSAQIAGGDADSFGKFYDAFFDLMYREARRLTGRDENTCLDIVHDSMLKAIHAMKPIDEFAGLQRWTRTVVKSVAYDWLRKERRQVAGPIEPESEPAGLDPTTTDVETLARLSWIEEEMQNADPGLQRLFSLRYCFGWTLQRIANHLGLKTGAVDGRIRRAIEQLREKAEREFGSET